MLHTALFKPEVWMKWVFYFLLRRIEGLRLSILFIWTRFFRPLGRILTILVGELLTNFEERCLGQREQITYRRRGNEVHVNVYPEIAGIEIYLAQFALLIWCFL